MVAVKDQSVPFQVEIPLEVEKSVWAELELRNKPTPTNSTCRRDIILRQFPNFLMVSEPLIHNYI